MKTVCMMIQKSTSWRLISTINSGVEPEGYTIMKWTPEAEKAIKKVPFFVRKKVRLRVENEARDKGKNRITPDDVKATKAAYLSNMSSEVKGYQIDTCFGSEGCQNRANKSGRMVEKIGDIFRNEDLLSFLKERVLGDLKPHHEFRVTVADCPNACSQPQIKDIGLIGARIPEITDKECSLCNLCVDICREKDLSGCFSGGIKSCDSGAHNLFLLLV